METAQIAENLTKELLDFMGVEARISVEADTAGLKVNTTVDEAGFLIGHGGENLRALQHILLLMVSKKTGNIFYPGNFVLDINNYQKEREDYLTSLAKNTALEVLESKKTAELPPLCAAERRIVHLAVEKIEGVASQSVGEGEERRVVIKPV
ncbi:MAG: KH domain-containing protein [Parcubacteria group bacterium]|nr:KH domain-containing protein [Parcubacteria group bacterium]